MELFVLGWSNGTEITDPERKDERQKVEVFDSFRSQFTPYREQVVRCAFR
jgi:hypothetical protein